MSSRFASQYGLFRVPYTQNMSQVRASVMLAAFGLCAFGTGAAHAQAPAAEATGVELAAMLGGRIIGAAKACGINADRVRRTSERLASVVSAKAGSTAERDNAKAYFAAAQASGAELVRFEKSKCSEIHVSFSEIEVKLGRAPAADNDPLAAKRGVPAIGAIKLDTGSANLR